MSRAGGQEGIRRRHPRLRVAVPADARLAAAHRGERHEFRSAFDTTLQILRLAVVSDAFIGQILYRVKARLQGLGVPGLPRIAQRLAIVTAQIKIGDPVVMDPGIYIPHGGVVVDGLVEVRGGVVISPGVTIGLRDEWTGPTIGPRVSIGTGAKVLGAIQVGAGARIGANAVVIEDVPPGATAVGVPARVVGGRR